ncbi:MAG: Asp-tRNA(Asn)/Glu-tRNA(Gln) amidotransferase subunit GatC [Gammaproteobacteria bacterium]|nr:Asp-tRNA(Asn)/Glu-tRNA(Gln) amidotransferase subunit GatC [Gammaproteobacteria bacterium]
MDDAEVKKISDLARLAVSENDLPLYRTQLSNIVHFVEKIASAETGGISPMAHPVSSALRMREDCITEGDERERFQSIAPSVEAGFYLVPQVIP